MPPPTVKSLQNGFFCFENLLLPLELIPQEKCHIVTHLITIISFPH